MKWIALMLVPFWSAHIAAQTLDFQNESEIYDYLNEQAPDSVISKFECPIKKHFSFDGIEKCAATCGFGSESVFSMKYVNTSYIARSSDRVSLYVDVAENIGEASTDAIGSFPSTIACTFSGMNPVTPTAQ